MDNQLVYIRTEGVEKTEYLLKIPCFPAIAKFTEDGKVKYATKVRFNRWGKWYCGILRNWNAPSETQAILALIDSAYKTMLFALPQKEGEPVIEESVYWKDTVQISEYNRMMLQESSLYGSYPISKERHKQILEGLEISVFDGD